MSVKKNAFVEGLANYRDFLQVHTRITPRRAAHIFLFAFIIPAGIGAVAAYHTERQDVNRRRLFPERNGQLRAMK